ncbi:MAG TPA: phage shock protein operon transcriptional activator [Stellaceae bacterium]|nr:phage shock protein operon transcriptional activator [Stellaceae bacterium]
MVISTIPDLPPLIGAAPSFQTVLAQVSQLAPLDRPVLVVGERGTGKELIATRLALLSPRWDRPFMTVNCAALAETLLDSELFGHEAGAFTGAQRRRPSRFELADGGTLFLDEIAAASLSVQEKLLRVIEYGAFTRVGGNEPLSVDVRVIAATNVDLPEEAAAGRFRSDLLDRLAFDVVTLPPLAARREDIPLLADHFARAMARALGWAAFPGFAPAAMAAMAAHPWPGNVRELKNAVERSVYRAEPGAPIDRIVLDPFASPWRPHAPAASPPTTGPAAESGPFLERVQRLESGMLREALAQNGFNQRRAAAALGLSYHQFRHYLRKYELVGPHAARDGKRLDLAK